MPSTDRTMIAPLLLEFFPEMEKATSDEWHGFLNAKTGLNISLSEFNTSAFDRWRQALAMQFDLPVWPYTATRIAQMQADGQRLKAAEDARVEAQSATLVRLADLAPTKTPADLIKDAWKSFKI